MEVDQQYSTSVGNRPHRLLNTYYDSGFAEADGSDITSSTTVTASIPSGGYNSCYSMQQLTTADVTQAAADSGEKVAANDDLSAVAESPLDYENPYLSRKGFLDDSEESAEAPLKVASKVGQQKYQQSKKVKRENIF